MRSFLAIAAAATLSGCGTVTRGTTEQVQIISNPPEARATSSLGHSCSTPCTITVGRKDEFSVVFEKDGYERAQVPVTTEIATAGGAAFAGNILLGGVVGMGADAATGAAFNHEPNPVSVVLRPINRHEPSGDTLRRRRTRNIAAAE